MLFRSYQPEAVQPDSPEDSFVFSRRAVTNCLMDKVKAKLPKPEPKVRASDLEKRLALLKY